MDDRQVQDILRRAGIRVGPAVAAYVQRRLAASGPLSGGALPAIPVIGSDARTGIPRRMEIPVTQFQQFAGEADGLLPFAQAQL